MLDPTLSAVRSNPPGSDGGRFYTIQRVNGNGLNGKGDGTTAVHQHTLEDSDRIKKSTVHRYFLKEEKDSRKFQVRTMFIAPQSWPTLTWLFSLLSPKVSVNQQVMLYQAFCDAIMPEQCRKAHRSIHRHCAEAQLNPCLG